MTTFDLIALLITILIIVILLFFGVVWKLLDDIKEWQKSVCDKLCSIRSDTVDIFQELNDIEDNILDGLMDIRLADKIVGSGFQNGFPPCYAPNGICTNPQMDCINCPKRGTGGTWSTSTNTIKED